MELTANERDSMTLDKRTVRFLRSLLARQEAAIIIPFFVLLAFFYSRNSAMLVPTTVVSILRTMAFPGLISMGMVQLMIAGEIDLSTGAMMSLSAVFAAKLIRDLGVPIPMAVVCSLGVRPR